MTRQRPRIRKRRIQLVISLSFDPEITPEQAIRELKHRTNWLEVVLPREAIRVWDPRPLPERREAPRPRKDPAA